MSAAYPVMTRFVGEYDGSLFQVTWDLTSDFPVGASVEIVEWADRTLTLSGNWGIVLNTATATLEGSNDEITWFPFHNAATAVTAVVTGDAMITVVEIPRYARPNLTTPGVGADVKVILLARRASPMRT